MGPWLSLLRSTLEGTSSPSFGQSGDPGSQAGGRITRFFLKQGCCGGLVASTLRGEPSWSVSLPWNWLGPQRPLAWGGGRVLRQGPAELCPPGPVFVVQWLFDEAQLTVDNVHLTGQPVQEGQWLYIQNLGRELRNTLKDVP